MFHRPKCLTALFTENSAFDVGITNFQQFTATRLWQEVQRKILVEQPHPNTKLHTAVCADELFVCKGDLGFVVLYRVYGILLCDSCGNVCLGDLLHILRFCDMQVRWMYVCVWLCVCGMDFQQILICYFKFSRENSSSIKNTQNFTSRQTCVKLR